MPQAMNVKVLRDKNNSPVGPGSVYNTVLVISGAARERAIFANKTEMDRFQKIEKLIQKDQRTRENVQNRVIEKLRDTLKEREAFRNVVEKDYRFDDFITMKKDFDPNHLETRKIARRYILESRVFRSGFTMKTLKPEIRRKLKKLDINQQIEHMKKKLLKHNKEESNVLIDRTMSNSAFYRMLGDQTHWREYNKPKLRKVSQAQNGISDIQVDIAHAQEHFPPIASQEGQVIAKDQDTKEVPEQLQVAPVRPEAHRVTMGTLGPAYFLASSWQEVK